MYYLSNFRESLSPDKEPPNDRVSREMTASKAENRRRHVKWDFTTDPDSEDVFLNNDESLAATYRSRPNHRGLHHSDSHSSGIFSQVTLD